ncbi:MAG: hypothetical protein ACOZCO_06965 [Bacteroidota bacterium]
MNSIQLPVEIRKKGSRSVLITGIILIVGITGMQALNYFSGNGNFGGSGWGGMLFMYAFLMVIILIGLLQLKKEYVHISVEGVKMEMWTFFGGKKSSFVPLNEYKYLYSDIFIRSGSKGSKHHGPDRIVYNIKLIHSNRDKSVVIKSRVLADSFLGDDNAELDHRNDLEHLAELFQLDIVETDGKRTVFQKGIDKTRSYKETDKTVKQQVKEGKFQRSFASSGEFPKGMYKLKQDGDTIIVTAQSPWLFLISIAVITGWVIFFLNVEKTATVLSISPVFFVFSAIFIVASFLKDITVITPKTVTHSTVIGKFYQMHRAPVQLSEVEEADIRYRHSKYKAVYLKSDKAIVYLFGNAKKPQQEWLLDKIIEMVIRNK